MARKKISMKASAYQKGFTMGRGRRKNNSIKGISASADQLNEELADRFDNLSLTPTSQKKKTNKRRTRKDQFAETSGSHQLDKSHAIPLIIHKYVKDAVDIMNRPGWPNDVDRYDSADLKLAEYKIGLARTVLHDHLPLGWDYDREHASSLIEGYCNEFTGVNGITFLY